MRSSQKSCSTRKVRQDREQGAREGGFHNVIKDCKMQPKIPPPFASHMVPEKVAIPRVSCLRIVIATIKTKSHKRAIPRLSMESKSRPVRIPPQRRIVQRIMLVNEPRLLRFSLPSAFASASTSTSLTASVAAPASRRTCSYCLQYLVLRDHQRGHCLPQNLSDMFLPVSFAGN